MSLTRKQIETTQPSSVTRPPAVLRFQLSDAPGAWPIVVGASDETEDEIRDRLRARYGDRLIRTARYRCDR